jgi:2-polyprenyl-3-methyl-5-hydroxy-6-metoxy-1,4-benzoquinol methylase
MTSARLATIVSAVSQGGPVHLDGKVPRFVADCLRRYGIEIGPFPSDDATTVLYRSFDDLDRAEKGRLIERVSASRNLVIHGETAADRDLVESLAFGHGYGLHPAYLSHVGYSETLDHGYWCLLRKVEPRALALSPKARIGGFLDVTRIGGNDALGSLFRYAQASEYIRPGDTVVEYGSGAGFGSDMLRSTSQCASVVGLEPSLEAVSYAETAFRQEGLSFRTHTASEMIASPSSTDVLVVMDRLRDSPARAGILDQARLALRPGGRLVFAVPPGFTDRAALFADVESRFAIEAVHAQTVTGSRDVRGVSRKIEGLSSARPEEWLLAVAFLDPVRRPAPDFTDTIYPFPDPTANLLSFARDYENPWLMRTMFGMGVRIADGRERSRLATRVLETASPSSPDAGAALCVLGYADLESGSRDRIASFVEDAPRRIDLMDGTPHSLRWQVSLRFLLATMQQSLGETDAALASYEEVVGSDWLSFSPTLGTKAAEAAYRAGMILFSRGQRTEARAAWSRGLAVAGSVMASGRSETVGDPACPLPDALYETVQALEAARKCADCLRSTHGADPRSAQAKWLTMIDDRAQETLRSRRVADDRDLYFGDSWRWRRALRKSGLFGRIAMRILSILRRR